MIDFYFAIYKLGVIIANSVFVKLVNVPAFVTEILRHDNIDVCVRR